MQSFDNAKKLEDLTRRNFIILAALAGLGSILGCEQNPNSSYKSDAVDASSYKSDAVDANGYPIPRELPKSTDNIVFDEHAKIGKFHIGMGQWTDVWRNQNPDYQIYENHTGGQGDTLEFVSYNRGIYLQWAWATLMTISVFNSWSGEVEGSGIKLGSSLEDFLSKYPKAVISEKTRFGPNDPSWFVAIYVPENIFKGYGLNPNGETRLTADFASDKIKRLRIDSWARNVYNGYWGP